MCVYIMYVYTNTKVARECHDGGTRTQVIFPTALATFRLAPGVRHARQANSRNAIRSPTAPMPQRELDAFSSLRGEEE